MTLIIAPFFMAIYLSKEELPVIIGAYKYYLRKGIAGSEEVLLKALYSFIPRSNIAYEMSHLYLFSNNQKLEEGAREWIHTSLTPIDRFLKDLKSPQWGEDSLK